MSPILPQTAQRVNAADYQPFDDLMLSSSEATFIKPQSFFALIQRKTLQPHVFVLYDLQGR